MLVRIRVYKKLARIPFFDNLKGPGIFLILGLIALMLFSIMVILPSASPVNVTSSSSQAKLGIYMVPYFENANAPLISSPVTVDLQMSKPSSSGSFIIPRGISGYLWTSQFSSATSIPTGKMTLDLWAGATPSLDGQASVAITPSQDLFP